MQILAALSTVANSPFAQKVLHCVFEQKGVPAILACIMATPSTTGPEAIAKDSVTAHLQAHVAGNP
jgi:hypothetical protein